MEKNSRISEKYIGILFDVSGSMKESFDSLTKKKISKSDELTNILQKLCEKQNVHVFSLFFGCKSCNKVQDFLSLLEISKKYFKDDLKKSEDEKVNKNGCGRELENMLSKNKSRPLFIDEYIYDNEKSPSEKLCEFFINLLKEDQPLIDEIYNSLPKLCTDDHEHSNYKLKRNVGIGGVTGLSGVLGVGLGVGLGVVLAPFLGPLSVPVSSAIISSSSSLATGFGGNKIVSNNEREKTTEVIIECFENAINSKIDKIIKEEFDLKNNNPKIVIKEGKDVINLIHYFDNKFTNYDKGKDFNVLDMFKKYIYGNTPLYTCINISVNSFPENKILIDKFLIIISDGLLNDVDKNFDYISDIKKKTKDIKVIGIYLTNQKIYNEKKLLDDIPYYFDKGAKDLMEMSSLMNYEDSIIKFFILKGWDIPTSGDCKLFVEINNSQNLNEFIKLINEAVDYKDNGLINDISSAAIQTYVNSEINNFQAREQKGGTCYANAISACTYLSSSRVYGRKKLIFEELRKELIDKYGVNGANTFEILTNSNFLKKYKLHSKEVNENDARRAIIRSRPCVAKFHLEGYQWGNFSKFFRENPKGILTKSIINQKNFYINEEAGGHAVVLVKISKNYLTLLNSWGSNWADNGYFKIENADVLNMKFCDIFWYISDLTQDEINAYNDYMKKMKDDIKNLIE